VLKNKNGFENQIIVLLIGAVIFVGLLCSCQTQPRNNTAPIAVNTQLPESVKFRIVGYVTAAVVVETIQFDKLTHINYAFLIPKSDGTFSSLPNAWKLDNIVEQAHQLDVKVLISVGGWGYDKEFEQLASNQETRQVFVQKLVDFVTKHNLDGVDIDWEYPDLETQDNFLTLMQDVKAALPQDKLLTAAVVAAGENGEGIPRELFPIIDFLNLMAYDGPTHAEISYAQHSLDYWGKRGLPQEKTVLGVPFFSHPNFIAYRKIIGADPSAANLDSTNYFGSQERYNGSITISTKTKLAMDSASGIMIWTLEHDSFDEDTSLLNTIYQTSNTK